MPISDVFAGVISEYAQGKRQDLANIHDEHMQVDEFYREAGIQKLEEAVTFFTHYLVNTDDISTDSKNGDLQTEIRKKLELIIVYGSARTIHDFGVYQQNNFNYSESKPDSQNKYEVMVFFAQIIVDLKYDFTGIRTNAIDLLKILINDIYKDDNQELLVSAYRIVMAKLGVPKSEKSKDNK